MSANEATLLIEALSAVWRAIQDHHPDVPSVVLLPAPSPHRQMNVLGHFAPLRWLARLGDATKMHEVVVVAEHLCRPAEDIVETLLHEAVHACNYSREPGKPDCSRSQYHNQRFKRTAEELGLAVTQVPHYGYALTALTPATAARYSGVTEALRSVLIHRAGLVTPEPSGDEKDPSATTPTNDDSDDTDKPTSTRSRKATCACPFIIRVAKATIDATTIRCESCGEPFRLA